MRSLARWPMGYAAILFMLVAGSGSVRTVAAQSVQSEAADRISGEWLVTEDIFGNPLYQKMTLKLENGKLTGEFGGDKLEGTVTRNALHFVARDEENNTEECTATLSGSSISGKLVSTDGSDARNKRESEFTATRPPATSTSPPQKHEFTPTVFQRQFSATNKPVLRI